VNVELRRLESKDLSVVEEIEREAYPTPWSRSMFDAELRKPSSLALGALEVRVSNTGAIRLYEQLGFEARGLRRGYYTDNREDAVIMWREPAPSEQAS